MAEALDILQVNLFSPLILAFVLGNIATLVKSDIELPAPIYAFIMRYLLFALGLRGGVELTGTALANVVLPALVAVFLTVAIPVCSYLVLRKLVRCDVANAAGIAAHYGAVSLATLLAGVALADTVSAPYAAYIPILVALMEGGVVVALVIGRWEMQQRSSPGAMLRTMLTGKRVLLLIGGLVIGALIGEQGYAPIKPVFGDLFHGALVLLLLEMGMVAARQLRTFQQAGFKMLAFGTLMPLGNGLVGVLLGTLAGMSVGGGFLLGALAASAAHIDVPAAVRASLPAANPGLSLTAALGITLPFNLVVGLPLYYICSLWFHRITL